MQRKFLRPVLFSMGMVVFLSLPLLGCDNDGDDDSNNVSTTEICDNNIDDDGDGQPDCWDRDCKDTSYCQDPSFHESDCLDGVDNDADGYIDCDDADCAGALPCHEHACSDASDNDGDGLVDCDDPDCKDDFACKEHECSDGVDNDGDTYTDCEDYDCRNSPDCVEYECSDGVDNDRDGATDCDDSDCVDDDACLLKRCDYPFADADGDGVMNMFDLDCIGKRDEELCFNGMDDDATGGLDCQDPACSYGCWEDCTNGVDDDGDGLVDQDDPVCRWEETDPGLYPEDGCTVFRAMYGQQNPCGEGRICELVHEKDWIAQCVPERQGAALLEPCQEDADCASRLLCLKSGYGETGVCVPYVVGYSEGRAVPCPPGFMGSGLSYYNYFYDAYPDVPLYLGGGCNHNTTNGEEGSRECDWERPFYDISLCIPGQWCDIWSNSGCEENERCTGVVMGSMIRMWCTTAQGEGTLDSSCMDGEDCAEGYVCVHPSSRDTVVDDGIPYHRYSRQGGVCRPLCRTRFDRELPDDVEEISCPQPLECSGLRGSFGFSGDSGLGVCR